MTCFRPQGLKKSIITIIYPSCHLFKERPEECGPPLTCRAVSQPRPGREDDVSGPTFSTPGSPAVAVRSDTAHHVQCGGGLGGLPAGPSLSPLPPLTPEVIHQSSVQSIFQFFQLKSKMKTNLSQESLELLHTFNLRVCSRRLALVLGTDWPAAVTAGRSAPVSVICRSGPVTADLAPPSAPSSSSASTDPDR